MITSKEVIISVSKSISKKILYVVVALAMLAMMIPAMAVSVSAAGSLTMTMVNPLDGSAMPEATPTAFNVTGSRVLVTANGLASGVTVSSWSIQNIATAPGAGAAIIVSSSGNTAIAQGDWGDAVIYAHLSDNSTPLSVEKKWGKIESTNISTSGSSAITWNEVTKTWSGTTTVYDNVTGQFYEELPIPNPPGPVDPTRPHILFHAAEGVILNWFLVPANVAVSTASGHASDLITYINTLGHPSHVSFSNSSMVYTMQTVTPASGGSSLPIYTNGVEGVQIVVIPQYPNFPAYVNLPVTPEVTSWDFYNTEAEDVPQVRWAGEKIVLDHNFGAFPANARVKFSLQNQSVGSLEGITGVYNFTDAGAVWTALDNGTASCILVSSDPGVAYVTAGLYVGGNIDTGIGGTLVNQHFFTVYYLKFESLTLGDVHGKRTMHNAGPWELIPSTPPGTGTTNPWDPTGSYNGTVTPTVSDNVTQTLNVSQDALLRARVRGWFTSSNPSVHPVRTIDPSNSSMGASTLYPLATAPWNTNALADNPPSATLTLPAGRWILPDDWAALAGPDGRMHWDINTDPFGIVGALNNEKGNYYKPATAILSTLVGAYPVVGPFDPGLELMTPSGWTIPNPMYDYRRPYNTVVPDGNIDMWDAPMPAAKIIYQIQNNADTTAKAGFFKATLKTDVYYLNSTVLGFVGKVYTNPFYWTNVPAHEAIPPFIDLGGYEWDSFGVTGPAYGPYQFWQFINQTRYAPKVTTTDPANHPTVVEVYSDNHGEAMVWLNGNWNLDLSTSVPEGASVDIQPGTTIAHTTVQATADYPYSRSHQVVQSNMDTKTWTWGGQVLGTDSHRYDNPNVTTNTYDTRMVLSIGTWDPTLGSSVVGVYPNQAAKSSDKMVWVWVTDRDGQTAGVLGATVNWALEPGKGLWIDRDGTYGKISDYNVVTRNIFVQNGFLFGTSGVVTDPAAHPLTGTSILRIPTSYEYQLFDKFWGPSPSPNPANPDPAHPVSPGGTSTIRADHTKYVVAAIKVTGGNNNYTSSGRCDITIVSHDYDAVIGQAVPGQVDYETDVDLSVVDALDDGIRVGDANCDGVVNMGDVTAVENMILGYQPVTSNAILNNVGTVNMGTVVKIERSILGLK
jgi:hypothetical protein